MAYRRAKREGIERLAEGAALNVELPDGRRVRIHWTGQVELYGPDARNTYAPPVRPVDGPTAVLEWMKRDG